MSFKFGLELGLSLVKPHMKERRKVTTNRRILSNMEIFLGKQQGGQGDGVEQQEGDQGGLLKKSQEEK